MEAAGASRSALGEIRPLTFTGARKSEIAGLEWSKVNLERSCLRLKKPKTGAKVIPLGPPALAIFAKLKPVEGSPYVFPAEAGGGFSKAPRK